VTAEIWMPVAGFPDYEASDLGRIRRSVPAGQGHACGMLIPWLGNHQYQTVGLARDGRSVRRLVHRLVCEAFHGTPPTPGHQVAHADGTRWNNRADNLRWATRAENMGDCVAHGTRATGHRHGRTTKPERTPRGERHGHAKLSEAAVIAIRSAISRTGRSLAAEHGVSPATVCLIRARKIWRHL
jgi:hypothetical protein